MTGTENSLLSEVEALLKERFSTDNNSPLPSTAVEVSAPERMNQLVKPENERGRMPFTKDKYLVKENPELVEWERETRRFLRKLSPAHGHRVSAAMVYEWATGILVKDLVAEGGSTVDLKRINKVLRFYFGKSYMTYICGKKVPHAYRVPVGYYIKRHRPMTLTLYAEYCEGVLNP